MSSKVGRNKWNKNQKKHILGKTGTSSKGKDSTILHVECFWDAHLPY